MSMAAPALLIIDVQQGLDDPARGERNNPDAEANIARLLAAWRRHGLPSVHVRHCSVEPDSKLRPELPGNAWKPEVAPRPGEIEITKTTNSAFVGTGLDAKLRADGIDALVVAGLTTDHCVSASVRSAADLGFAVTLVPDACAAFERAGFDGEHYSGEQIHRINLVSLDGEFCRLRNTGAVLAEIEATHPAETDS